MTATLAASRSTTKIDDLTAAAALEATKTMIILEVHHLASHMMMAVAIADLVLAAVVAAARHTAHHATGIAGRIKVAAPKETAVTETLCQTARRRRARVA